MKNETVVVTARVSAISLAEIARLLEIEWRERVRSKSELLRVIVDIAARRMIREKAFPDSASALHYLESKGLLNAQRSLYQELEKRVEGKEKWEMGGLEALEKARAELGGEDE